tara:strand:- start:829 stop:2418 length:1590 start_codon:yes stop_codon:yes gene_type:complete
MHMTISQPLKYGLILLGGILFSIYMFYSINDKYVVRNKAIIDTAISKVEVKMTRELEKVNLALEAMAVFVENSDDLAPDKFKEFTSPFVEDLFGVRKLGWASNTASDSGNLSLHGNEASKPTSVPTLGGNIFYITLIDPIHPNDTLGKNLNLLVDDPTIENSVQSKKITYSEPLKFSGTDQVKKGFVSMLSVYETLGNTPKGIIFGEFQMDDFIENTLIFELPILGLIIKDTLSRNRPLYLGFSEAITASDQRNEKMYINAANRVWEISVLPKIQYTRYPHAFESYLAMLLVLFSTLLLVLIIKQRDRYESDLIQEVGLRTQELEESNKLKENLLREIHHRVKNNLQITSSLINLQKRKLKDKETIQALESSQSRILAIALIHEKIYQDEGTKAVDLKSYLQDLINYHKNMAPSVQHTIQCPKISIDLDTAVPVALITSELVTNSFKHAFPTEKEDNKLSIIVKHNKDSEIELTISDNGIGLPQDFKLTDAEGLGFEIIHKLCRQIGAKFSWDASSSGTTFKLIFKQRS